MLSDLPPNKCEVEQVLGCGDWLVCGKGKKASSEEIKNDFKKVHVAQGWMLADL